ncbi:hypothetical protein B0T22DRAFT_193031 [Podospora appendiculata]|uniref:Uncharacterized protein n=1 Tax=Podospora appendiculata TaxID=314037 RepID=A0AAE0XDA0_9PEZI|nr:hypothetical protein B0T22DRAFT_193031 [Podospora appendiculata]
MQPIVEIKGREEDNMGDMKCRFDEVESGNWTKRSGHHPSSSREASVHKGQKRKDEESHSALSELEKNPLHPGRGRILGAGHDNYPSEPPDSTVAITVYGTDHPREPFLAERWCPEPRVPEVVARVEDWLFEIDERADPDVGEDDDNGSYNAYMSTTENPLDCVDVDDSLSMRGVKQERAHMTVPENRKATLDVKDPSDSEISNLPWLSSKPLYPSQTSAVEHGDPHRISVDAPVSELSDRDLVDRQPKLNLPRDPEEVDCRVKHLLLWLLGPDEDGSIDCVPEELPEPEPRTQRSSSITSSQNSVLARSDDDKNSTLTTQEKLQDLIQADKQKTWYFFFPPQLDTPDELSQILALPWYQDCHAHPACIQGFDVMAVDDRPVVVSAPPDEVFGEPVVYGWVFEIADETQETVVAEHFYNLDGEYARKGVDVTFRYPDGQDTRETVRGRMFNLQVEVGVGGRQVL